MDLLRNVIKYSSLSTKVRIYLNFILMIKSSVSTICLCLRRQYIQENNKKRLYTIEGYSGSIWARVVQWIEAWTGNHKLE